MRATRIAVVGSSGSGKSTFARRLSAAMGAEHVELDGINHQPGWTPIELAEFLRVVDERCLAEGTWVTDGNYQAVQPVIWARADLVVWLDPPTWRTMFRVIRRTIVRGVRRTELWNGNRESLRGLFSPDPQKNVVLWSWTRRHVIRDRYTAAMLSPPRTDLRFIRLCHPRECDALLATFSSQ